jgi:hypothetical protein
MNAMNFSVNSTSESDRNAVNLHCRADLSPLMDSFHHTSWTHRRTLASPASPERERAARQRLQILPWTRNALCFFVPFSSRRNS